MASREPLWTRPGLSRLEEPLTKGRDSPPWFTERKKKIEKIQCGVYVALPTGAVIEEDAARRNSCGMAPSCIIHVTIDTVGRGVLCTMLGRVA